MAGRRFTRAEIEQRRERVSQLYLQGYSLRKIAVEVGVHNTQVFLDIKAIRADWRANTRWNFEEKQNLELARLDQVELEAWKGWTRTIGKMTTIRKESGGMAGSKEVVTIEHKAGDPRFLEIVRNCVRTRCEILGLNAPVEARITGRLSIDDIREIIDAADKPELTAGPSSDLVQ
jgi:transposase